MLYHVDNLHLMSPTRSLYLRNSTHKFVSEGCVAFLDDGPTGAQLFPELGPNLCNNWVTRVRVNRQSM